MLDNYQIHAHGIINQRQFESFEYNTSYVTQAYMHSLLRGSSLMNGLPHGNIENPMNICGILIHKVYAGSWTARDMMS
jgi:hypothetical protein